MTTHPKRHLVTSALPYANGPLHIGHIAGAYLPADIYVKYLRMNQEDVVFVCGSDEHGAAITLRAKKEGISPQEIVDKYHEINKKAFADFGIDFDIYHRTSSELHHQTAGEFFKKLHENNVFEVQESEQFFDEEHQQFLADRYVTGTCPNCQSENAYGDQCEKCGSALSPTDLINPISTLSRKAPVMRKTKHWYLPMNKDEHWLKEWINNGELDGQKHHEPKEWRNQVIGQCNSWIDGGLGARAMTRDLDWGVKVPLKDAEGKVLYVWLDAPIGYISATKQWAKDHNKNWEDYWVKDENTHLTHFIAKDNIVFHAIIFPILLKAHGNLNLPYNVPANEFLNLEGDKISTSREWAVWLHEYIEEFEGKEDELRYVLTSIAPENKDSEFTWKDFQARVNNELVAILGNFVNRSLVLTQKYSTGVMPALGEVQEVDQVVMDEMAAIPTKVGDKIKAHKYREALTEAMKLARLGNKYLADTEPWKIQKVDPKRVETILHISNQMVANLAIVINPFLPHTAAKLNAFVGLNNKTWSIAGGVNVLSAGEKFDKPSLLFSKIEDEIIDKQVEKLNIRKAEKEKQAKIKPVLPQKENVSFEDFTKLDMRIGKVLEAEKVKKADKLLKLKVDTGIGIRTIVSGVAMQFAPEEIVNKQVVVLMNLPPRKIRGVVSEGMLLMAENENGELSLLQGDERSKPGNLIA